MKPWQHLDTSERINAVLTTVIALLTLVNVCTAISSTRQSTVQTSLNRQLLVGTQGAVIEVKIDPPDSALKNLTISLRNNGHVVASDVHVSLEVTRAELPSQKVMDQPERHEIKVPKLAPYVDRWDDHRYLLATPESFLKLFQSANTRALLIKGTISYDNGFPEHVGDRETDPPFCRAYFIFHGKTGTIANPFLACEDVSEVLREFEENENRREANPN
jgi:hypothetical protein